MAEYVSREHFEEFVKRMEERFDHAEERANQRFLSLEKRMEEGFDHAAERADQRFLALEKRMEQGFAYMEKARAQDLVYIDRRFAQVDQRFDGLNQQMMDSRAEMRQMRNWLVRLYGLVVFGFIGAIVLILFRDLIFK